jgi:hypothetical protein
MHDASNRSQVGSCPGKPSRGDQYLGRGEDAHHTSMGTRGARWPPWRRGRRPQGEWPSSQRSLRLAPGFGLGGSGSISAAAEAPHLLGKLWQVPGLEAQAREV